MAKILITSYKIDSECWQKANIKLDKLNLEAIRKGILSTHPSAKQCLFVYEEERQ